MESEGIEIECGDNAAILYRSKFRANRSAASRCILFGSDFYSPTEFERECGVSHYRKDWKKSMKYKGEALLTLVAEDRLPLHDGLCKCDWCNQRVDINRKRKAQIEREESDESYIDDESDCSYEMGDQEDYVPARALKSKRRTRRMRTRPKPKFSRQVVESSNSDEDEYECRCNFKRTQLDVHLLHAL